MGEGGEGVEKFHKTLSQLDQKWPHCSLFLIWEEWALSTLFLYFNRFRGKGRVGVLRGYLEVRGEEGKGSIGMT